MPCWSDVMPHSELLMVDFLFLCSTIFLCGPTFSSYLGMKFRLMFSLLFRFCFLLKWRWTAELSHTGWLLTCVGIFLTRYREVPSVGWDSSLQFPRRLVRLPENSLLELDSFRWS